MNIRLPTAVYVRCPYCRTLLDGSLNLSGRYDPRDWDPRVCTACGNVAVHDVAFPGGLRPPNRGDWDAWNEDGLAAQIAIAMHIVLTKKGT